MPSVLSLSLVVDAHEELEEVDGLRRRVLADRDAVAAADAVGGRARSAGDGREGEPAELVAEALLVGALVLLDRRAPTGPSAPWRPCRCRRPLPRRCRSRRLVAVLVRIEGVERRRRLHRPSCRRRCSSRRSGSSARARRRRRSRRTRYVHRCIDGHLSLPAIASGVMPASLSFWTAARYSSQVVGGAVMPACVKSVLVVPEADHAHVPRDAVLLALVLVDAHGARVDRVLPGRDVGGDVLEQAGVGLLGHAAAAPRLEQVGDVAAPGSSVASLVLNASFSRTVILIVTLGCAAVVVVGDRLEVGLARVVVRDVPPVDRDRRRLACGCRRGGCGRRRSRRGCR